MREVTFKGVTQEEKTLRKPVGLNTVQLLKAASTGLGLSPVTAMKVTQRRSAAVRVVGFPSTIDNMKRL